MRLLATLLVCLAGTAASAQTTWHDLHFGQSRDSVHSQLDNQSLPVGSTSDGNLQTNTDFPLPLPGLLYPIPMMATFQFDSTSRLAEITLSLDLPAMHHDWSSVGPDEALFTFAADKLAFALASQYGAPTFSSPTCAATAETVPCTIQWHVPSGVVELERLSPRHLRIHYLPPATTL